MGITSQNRKFKDERTDEHLFYSCLQTILPMGRQNRWRVCAVEF